MVKTFFIKIKDHNYPITMCFNLNIFHNSQKDQDNVYG